MYKTLKLKLGQYIIIPLGRKLAFDSIAGFWHFPSVFYHCWPSKSVLGSLGKFIVSCVPHAHTFMLIPRKAVWLVDQMDHFDSIDKWWWQLFPLLVLPFLLLLFPFLLASLLLNWLSPWPTLQNTSQLSPLSLISPKLQAGTRDWEGTSALPIPKSLQGAECQGPELELMQEKPLKDTMEGTGMLSLKFSSPDDCYSIDRAPQHWKESGLSAPKFLSPDSL